MRITWMLGAVLLVVGCNKEAKDYRSKSKATEAKLQLMRLSKNLKAYYVEKASYFAGKTGPTPATPCCKSAGGKCDSSRLWANDPVWYALDFMIDEPHEFQYTYESDGKKVHATAVGDLDCDGTSITYVLDMTEGQGGVPTADIKEPNLDDD